MKSLKTSPTPSDVLQYIQENQPVRASAITQAFGIAHNAVERRLMRIESTGLALLVLDGVEYSVFEKIDYMDCEVDDGFEDRFEK